MKPKAYSYIRFSTPDQIEGSLDRQLELSRQYAKEHGLDLDESMQDLGLSAFTGVHRTKGALGVFLRLVEDGKIPAGTVLLVENLDRLSREKPLKAIAQITSIVEAGIKVVTLQNGMEFTEDTLNESQLYLAVGELLRANMESKRKSFLIRKGWERNREKVRNNGYKLTKQCPMWLELSPDRKKFIPRKEVVPVIKQIFEMKLNGKGSDRIARELNQRNVWKPKKGTKINPKQPAWNTSTIDLLLHNNRKLIGELQLHRYERVDGKRVNIPDGEVIADYYPPIIDKDIFNRVQEMMRANSKNDGRGGGRGDLVNNLFGHLAYCSTCGSPMRYLNKGNATLHGKTQLKCAKGMNGFKCDTGILYYDEVEQAVLTYCKGLDVADILPNSENSATELSILQKQLQSKDWEISTINTTINNIFESAKSATTVAYRTGLEHTFSILNINLEKFKKEKQDIQNQITPLENNSQQTEEQIKSIKELIDKMKEMTGEERLNLRLNLRTQLRRLIKSIKVYAKDKTIAIFFQSGQAQLINLVTGKTLDRTIPPKSKKV